ncbi:hypothetical protein JZ751_023958 [Albula glossodonta]|uniref:Uncharacterized protein n=1 Tax=Albula glossodonta TaxID=121402 RepID=A0A8T2NJV0_9TELE|nr:hypothetical protein JZ751_023958 [Albula glossodonta]
MSQIVDMRKAPPWELYAESEELSSVEMHRTDLFWMPHWARVMLVSPKLRRGTSMVSTTARSYLAPYRASAAASTLCSVSVGRKRHWNLLPLGERTASSKLSWSLEEPAARDSSSSSTSLSSVFGRGASRLLPISGLLREAAWVRNRVSCSRWPRLPACPTRLSERLSLDVFSSSPRKASPPPPPPFLSMEGSTLYLLRLRAGGEGTLCRSLATSSAVSTLLCLRKGVWGWAWGAERSARSGGAAEGGRGATGGVRKVITSALLAWFKVGLLRPLEDFGLVTCIPFTAHRH